MAMCSRGGDQPSQQDGRDRHLRARRTFGTKLPRRTFRRAPMARSSTAFASLAILTALAAAPLSARAEAGNVVGGGGATITGGGDDMAITYSAGGAGGGGVLTQSGRPAPFPGSPGD